MQEYLTKIADQHTCPMAVMVRNDKVLTGLRNYTKDTWQDRSVWTIPGGRCDPNETVEQTLRREVNEEVGIIEFDIVDFIGEAPGAKQGDVILIFFCTTNQDALLMEPEKFSEWRWVTKDEYINNKIYSGFNLPAREMIVGYIKQEK